MTTFETLRVETSDLVTTITLARPELLNRFDAVQEREFVDALLTVGRDLGTRAVVLLAEGRAFSAGGDFDLMLTVQADSQARSALLDGARRLGAALLALPQPLVAGVQGAAIGLGATVALASDAVVASSNVVLADTHVAVGLVAGDGGALYWPQSAGMLRARRHLLTGDPLSAEQAHSYGLVTDLVDGPEEVAPRAHAIATRIASLPPLAVQGTKRALNQMTRANAGLVGETALIAEGVTLASEDLVEAISAFREKRPGSYRGR
jgi:enoyl-CoA hydratase